MKVTPNQIKLIHTFLPEEIKEDKKMKQNLIAQYTGDKDKTSTKDLSFLQAQELLYFLQTGKKATNEAWATFDKHNKQHMAVLHYAHELGWETNKGFVDLDRLGGWLKKYGKHHKPLMNYSSKELHALIHQLEIMVSKSYSEIKKRVENEA